MLKKSYYCLGMALLCLWPGQYCLAGQTNYTSAAVSNAFLDIGPSARAAGMGEAYTWLADDAASLHWNPAGLGQVRGLQARVMHGQWLQDVLYEHGALAIPLANGALAASVTYVNYGQMDEIDDTGRLLGQFSVADLGVSAGYGFELLDRFLVGAGLKVPMNFSQGESRSSWAADLGVLWRPEWAGFQFGACVQNLGSGTGGENQPTQVRAGVGFAEPVPGLRLGLDAGKSVYADDVNVSIGGEYTIANLLCPRVGYQYSSVDQGLGSGLTGLSAGLGIRLLMSAFALNVDYAYVPYGDLGATHRVCLGLDLGAPVAQAGTTGRAASAGRVAAVSSAPAQTVKAPAQTAVAAAPRPAVSYPLLPPPQGVKVKIQGKKATLSWAGVPESAGYNVYLREGSRGKHVRKNSVMIRGVSYSLGNLAKKRTYFALIKTVNAQGREGKGSQEKKIVLK